MRWAVEASWQNPVAVGLISIKFSGQSRIYHKGESFTLLVVKTAIEQKYGARVASATKLGAAFDAYQMAR
jgi:hypothetical protein